MRKYEYHTLEYDWTVPAERDSVLTELDTWGSLGYKLICSSQYGAYISLYLMHEVSEAS
jgi:hypothetical protein